MICEEEGDQRTIWRVLYHTLCSVHTEAPKEYPFYK